MKSRSERHSTTEEKEVVTRSRADKNKYLYDDINNKIGFEDIIEFDDNNKIDLSSINATPEKRNDYRQDEEYQTMERNTKEESEEENKTSEKIYDINAVLENAKQNRSEEVTELESRRKLQNEEYNVLANLNKKYIDKKEKLNEELEKEGIEELINTITSNSLAQDIKDKLKDDEDTEEDKDLMSDLMATNADLNVKIEEGMMKDIIEQEEKEDSNTFVDEDGKIVNSFYTRSMDLSEQDFEIKDEIEEENRARRKILILVVSIILIILVIAGLFIVKKLNII